MSHEPTDAVKREIRVMEAQNELFRAIAAELLGDRELSSDLVLSKGALDVIVKDLRIENKLKAYLSGYFNVQQGE